MIFFLFFIKEVKVVVINSYEEIQKKIKFSACSKLSECLETNLTFGGNEMALSLDIKTYKGKKK